MDGELHPTSLRTADYNNNNYLYFYFKNSTRKLTRKVVVPTNKVAVEYFLMVG